ncbi:MAG: hemerythrin domain-containing protein [Sphingobium sp.]|uniref:hemerythrin domain-containing protein n=1 Tax=Sphingobium sp. TaxID=1912891 RepID=UPI0029AA4F97|nr:hemerythrin domain-containing protein [Sphingobium sp.]MDX3911073.1 hemerythrin domain-containing protein [Sphingobium sp.]
MVSRSSFARAKTKSVTFGSINRTVAMTVGAAAIANIGRKLAVQSPTTLAGDWFDGLVAEHRMVMKLFDVLQATDDSSTAKRGMLIVQITHALSKHAFEEENVIYTALRNAGRVEDADRLNHEHGYVKQYLADLNAMKKDDSGFLEKVSAFRRHLETHIRSEEDELFPALRAHLDGSENSSLTRKMNVQGLMMA